MDWASRQSLARAFGILIEKKSKISFSLSFILTCGTQTGIVDILLVSFPSALRDLRFEFCDLLHWLKRKSCQSIIHHGCGASENESMSVLTDLAKYGIVNSELTNFLLTTAVLGNSMVEIHRTREYCLN